MVGKNIKAGEGVERRRQAGVQVFSQVFREGPLLKRYQQQQPEAWGVQARWPLREQQGQGSEKLCRRSEGKWGWNRLEGDRAGAGLAEHWEGLVFILGGEPW